MSLEKNKAIIRRLFEELNKRNLASRLALLDELMASDYVEHTQHACMHLTPTNKKHRRNIRKWIARACFRKAFSEIDL